MDLNPYLTLHKNHDSKSVQDLIAQVNTVKLLEEIIGDNFHDFGVSKHFLVWTQKAWIIQTKLKKLNIKMKNFCSSKNTTKICNAWRENIYSTCIWQRTCNQDMERRLRTHWWEEKKRNTIKPYKELKERTQ